MIGELIRNNPDNGNKMYSIIHWQKGQPNEQGDYLVSTADGEVKMVGLLEFSKGFRWLGVDKDQVIAWCKLSDIKPYKEEIK